MSAWKEHLGTVYFNPKYLAAYAGPDKMQRVLKNEGFSVSKNSIAKWLQDQDSYSLHKPIVRKFKRTRVITTGIDDLWDVDLADVSNTK